MSNSRITNTLLDIMHSSTSSKAKYPMNKMLVVKEAICPFLATLVMLTVTPLLLEGIVMEQMYQWPLSNCNFTGKFTTKTVSSLLACALRCTHTTICKSFAWKQGHCGLLDTCPRCCDHGTVGGNGWTVYCTGGKTYIGLCWGWKKLKTIFWFLFLSKDEQLQKEHILVKMLTIHLNPIHTATFAHLSIFYTCVYLLRCAIFVVWTQLLICKSCTRE